METKNVVFIATSLDGYIADQNGGIAWLNFIPNPDNNDMGYHAFMKGVDAIIMGRTTFETVCDFDIDWPYTMPVFVLSNSMNSVPEKYENKVEIVNGKLQDIIYYVNEKGYKRIYIDGGRTIQSFLKADLIDEITITIIPYLLGGGISLFGKLPKLMKFECIGTKVYLDKIVQNQFVRIR